LRHVQWRYRQGAVARICCELQRGGCCDRICKWRGPEMSECPDPLRPSALSRPVHCPPLQSPSCTHPGCPQVGVERCCKVCSQHEIHNTWHRLSAPLRYLFWSRSDRLPRRCRRCCKACPTRPFRNAYLAVQSVFLPSRWAARWCRCHRKACTTWRIRGTDSIVAQRSRRCRRRWRQQEIRNADYVVCPSIRNRRGRCCRACRQQDFRSAHLGLHL
jgi:hypothetical protein